MLSVFSLKALSLKKELKIPLAGNEPLKLTLKPKAYGYTGTELAGILQEKNIICEFYDPDYVVMMLSYENGDGVFDKIKGIWVGNYDGSVPLEKILLDTLDNEYDFPIIKSNNFGHTEKKTVIPVGGRVRIDTSKKVKIELVKEMFK